ncbi:MAG: ATP synthase F0 subunit C [Thermodesulfobacteriota bacterium]
MIYLAALALAIGFGLAVAAVGSAFGIGKAAMSALDGTARQPEAANDLRVTLIIGAALMEALTIYVLVVSVLLMGKLPDAEAIIELLKHIG